MDEALQRPAAEVKRTGKALELECLRVDGNEYWEQEQWPEIINNFSTSKWEAKGGTRKK